MQYEQWQEDIIREVKAECSGCDPLAVLRIRGFVSRSKGRGRKRKHWREVTLVNYAHDDGEHFHALNAAPLDTYVVGLYGRECDQIDKRNFLRSEIERRAHGNHDPNMAH